MAMFREFFLIQSRHDGRFLTSEMTYTHIANRAGRLYDYLEARETAQYNLDDDFVIFSAYEKIIDGVH